MCRPSRLVRAAALAATALALPLDAGPSLQQGDYWTPAPGFQGRHRGRRRVRSLVQFDLVVERPGQPVPVDPDQPRPKSLDDVQDRFLEILGKKRDDRDDPSQLFEQRPFLALDLRADDIRKLKELQGQFDVDGERVRFRVEPARRLFRAGPAAVAGDFEGELSTVFAALGGALLPEQGAGTTIVVIDEGVDPGSGAVPGTVVDGSTKIGAAPLCPAEGAPELPDDPAAGAPVPVEPYAPSHGTLVAAIASTFAPAAEVVSIRVGDGAGATVPDVIAALEEVHCRWKDEHAVVAAVVLPMANADIDEEDYPAHYALVKGALQDLEADGIPVVIAAGNDALVAELAFPADVAEAVSIGGVNRNGDERAGSSNWAAELDLCAPSTALGLSVPWSSYDWGCSGTSYAAPIVAGLLARLRERYPECSTSQILGALKLSGREVRLDTWDGPIVVPRVQVDACVALLDALCGAPGGEIEPEPEPEPDPEPDLDPGPEDGGGTGSAPPGGGR